jgi:cholesterol transport system auxiliary component
MILRRHLALTPVIGALLLLGGCFGKMLSGGPPEALYRFGDTGPDAAAQAVTPAALTLVLDQVAFAPEIDGDRLLAVHGDSVRYIAGMRWVSGAPGLFGQSVIRSFAVHATALRLLPRQTGGIATLGLSLDIARFEAHYDDDAMDTPPVVVIEGDATLVRLSDRTISATHHFSARAPADLNRGAAIAAAFDTATNQATAQIADWAQATGATLAGPVVAAK